MKKISKLLVLAIMCVFTVGMIAIPCSSFATEDDPSADDGCYTDTAIEDITYDTTADSSSTGTKTKTATKSVYYKNSNGTVLWYVKVRATFTYNGSTSKCTSAAVSAASKSSYWKIGSKSVSKASNYATARATGKRYFEGTLKQTVTKSVTIKCSASGKLS